jgi:deazaflavin-dependent oxidoreductase (nitroreductase family)
VNPLTPLAVRIGAIPWLPRFVHQIVALDRFLRWASRDRVTLLHIAGLPSLWLTTTGRRSGQRRTAPLLCVPHHGTFLVAGSNWGAPRLPAWALNLRAHPQATVSFNRRRMAVLARQADGAERDELWQVMLRTWPNYAKYAERTDREIPVFVLEPRGA